MAARGNGKKESAMTTMRLATTSCHLKPTLGVPPQTAWAQHNERRYSVLRAPIKCIPASNGR